MSNEWTEKEQQVLKELQEKTGLSEHRVLLQGLRLYQLVVAGNYTVEPQVQFRSLGKAMGDGAPAKLLQQIEDILGRCVAFEPDALEYDEAVLQVLNLVAKIPIDWERLRRKGLIPKA